MKTDYSKLEMFKHGDGYHHGVGVALRMDTDFTYGPLVGRMANKAHDYGILAQCISESGNLPYVETGTLYGASLMVACHVKNRFNLGGTCFGIDPLKGYYPAKNTLPDMRDPLTGLVPNEKILLENLRTENLDNYALVPQESFPFPESIADMTFGCAFIDGDHDGEMPWLDWLNFKLRTKHYIVFDNYDLIHDSVRKAVIMAARDPDWDLVHLSSIVAVFKSKI